MADEEVVLTSFVLEDETLVETWSVTGVKRGRTRVPSTPVGHQLVAVTDRRFLWYDGELGEVDRDAVVDVEWTDFSHTSSPAVVRGGQVLFALGLVATIGAILFTDFPIELATMPAATGLSALLVTIVVARARGETGDVVDLQRVVVETDEDAATIWGEGPAMDELTDVIEAGEPRSEVDVDETEDADASARRDDVGGDGERADADVEAERDNTDADETPDRKNGDEDEREDA